MTYEEVKGFIGKRAIVKATDGVTIKGLITNTESEFDTSSGKEEIEIEAGEVVYGVPIDEIKKIIEI